MKTDYRDIAQMYYDEDFNCIPLKDDKSPALPSGMNYLYEKLHPIDSRFVSYGLGITCGIASDGMECIDFDAHQGQKIEPIFNQFVSDPEAAAIISENNVALYKTPSGGFHIVYRCKQTTKTQTLARYPDGNVMIEVRAGGAYIAVDPTPGYELIGGAELIKIGHIVTRERDYLLELARTYSHVPEKKQSENPMEEKRWGNWDDKTPWGKFNIKPDLALLFKLLRENKWYNDDKMVRKGLNRDDVIYWRRPGKEKGISATFNQFPNMFYCWTDAAEAAPFQKQQAYSPTDLLMHLQFKGDWQKTKAFLYDKYDMKPPEPATMPADEVDVMPFPLEVFSNPLQEFITELNRTLNYKQDFLAVALMFAVATLNGNKYKLKVKNGWTAATTFWFAVVGESGVMKSHPINTMVKPIKEIDKIEFETYTQQVNALTDEEKKKHKPVFRQILVEDFTLEAVHAIHRSNPRGLGVHKDELVGFLKDMNKYRNGSDEQFWLESFNNSSYIVNRVTKEPMMIDNIMVNIIGSIQPQVLSNVANASDGNGLIERFLYTTSESNVYPISLDDIDIGWMNWYKEVLLQIHNLMTYAHVGNTVVMQLSKEAMQRFIEVDKALCEIQMDDNEANGIKNYINKMKTYMPRFALLLWLMDAFTVNFDLKAEPLGKEYIDRAEKLVMYFIASARKVFSDSERREEITSVTNSYKMKGMTKAEQIYKLAEKGFKQVDIANIVKSPKSYVSKVLQEYNRKTGVK